MIAASSDVLTRALKLCVGRRLEACDLSLCRNSALQADGGNASLPGSTPAAPCRKLNTSSEQGPASVRRNPVAMGLPRVLAAATLGEYELDRQEGWRLMIVRMGGIIRQEEG